jgi:hypothetical protein
VLNRLRTATPMRDDLTARRDLVHQIIEPDVDQERREDAQ